MKNLFIILLVSSSLFAQENKDSDDKQLSEEINIENQIVNPKNKWFFGAEAGLNSIESFQLDDSKNSLHAGLLVEYYFAKNWSLSVKLKYFKTGVSFDRPGSGGGFGLGFNIIVNSSAYSGTFKGEIISIPLNIKWEYKIYKNFRGNLIIGYTLNREVKSNYSNYSSNLNPEEYRKNYGGSVFGLGFNYFLNSNSAVFLDYGIYGGTSKGKWSGGGLFSSGSGEIVTANSLVSIGFKYSFKK